MKKVLKLSSNLINNSNIPGTHLTELKLADTQINRLNKSGNKNIHIRFSATQLKHQGLGIWDSIMKMGRWIGKAGSKIANSTVGTMVKGVLKPVAKGLLSGVAEVGGQALGAKICAPKEEAPPVTTTVPPESVTALATQQGTGLYRVGTYDNGLYRVGTYGNGMYRAGMPIYGLGMPQSDIIIVLSALIKLLSKNYTAISSSELQSFFRALLELERKQLSPKKMPEKVKEDIKK